MCKTTREGLTSTVLNLLEENDIPLHDMQGQGYDNSANMIGKHQGVQKSPRVFFVLCYSHRLIAKEPIYAVKIWMLFN